MGAVILALLALWHASPVLLWHLRFADELGREPHGERLEAEVRDALPAAPPGWTELHVEGLTIRAPLRGDQHARCALCDVRCVLALDGAGTLAIFDGPPDESYGEALDRFAPDEGDVSLLRSVARNWQTIDALTDRVRAPGRLPATWRYRGAGSRGVVSAFHPESGSRWMVYAYADDGRPARMVGVSGISEATFTRILASVDVRDDSGRGAGCR